MARDFQKFAIVALGSFCLGWGAQSLMGIALRKSANSRFVAESGAALGRLRSAVAAFRSKAGRFPAGSGVAELTAAGYLDPADPPQESLRRGARWVPAWDGEGGFVYLSATGEVFLNADVSREKFLRADWVRIRTGGLFPPGKVY